MKPDPSPHLKYVAALRTSRKLNVQRCNFSDVDVSPGSVATQLRCGGLLHDHSVGSLLRNMSVKEV